MQENEIAKEVVQACIVVHKALGPGLFESVYELALIYELKKRGLGVVSQVPIEVIYDGVQLGVGFRADMIVNEKVLLELKSVEETRPIHKKQVINYLKLTNLKLGLLLNSNTRLMKDGITRLVNGL